MNIAHRFGMLSPASTWPRQLALATTLVCLIPTTATAGFGYKNLTSDRVMAACESRGLNLEQCISNARFIDPDVDGVTSFHFKTQYDTSRYIFDPLGSGAIGPFASGGDVGPGPGSGTELLQTMPIGSFKFGMPLPGSTFTYTDVNGILTIDMTFAAPVYFSGDSNVLLLNFKFIKPLLLDVSKSYVTYDPVNPGSDFTTLDVSCITTGATNACGSNMPTAGVSTVLVPGVPEPATVPLVLAGLAVAIFGRRPKSGWGS